MSTHDPARARFFAIAAMRFVGAALVAIGLLIVNGRLGLPAPLGYTFVAFGLFDLLVMPAILARRWRSPPQ